MRFRIGDATSIRVTFEVTPTVPTRHRLSRLRWLLVAIGLICFVNDLAVAARFVPFRESLPVWILMALFSATSVATCLADMSLYGSMSPLPGSPSFSPRHQSGQVTPAISSLSTQRRASSSSKNKDPTSVEEGVETEALMGPNEDERLPFLPPRPSSVAEKSDDDDDENGKPPFHPNKMIIILDAVLTFALGGLFIANLIVDSLIFKHEGIRSEAYALRTIAMLGTFLAMVLHFHCFAKGFKALRKNKGNNGYERVRTGAVRL